MCSDEVQDSAVVLALGAKIPAAVQRLLDTNHLPQIAKMRVSLRVQSRGNTAVVAGVLLLGERKVLRLLALGRRVVILDLLSSISSRSSSPESAIIDFSLADSALRFSGVSGTSSGFCGAPPMHLFARVLRSVCSAAYSFGNFWTPITRSAAGV